QAGHVPAVGALAHALGYLRRLRPGPADPRLGDGAGGPPAHRRRDRQRHLEPHAGHDGDDRGARQPHTLAVRGPGAGRLDRRRAHRGQRRRLGWRLDHGVDLPLRRVPRAAEHEARGSPADRGSRPCGAVVGAVVGGQRRGPGAAGLRLQRRARMTAPVPGVVYTFDSAQQAFVAPGREALVIGPAGWVAPDPVKAGSLPVGEARYGVPDTGQVLFVDPSGSDGAAGTIGAPKKTLAGALSAASTGAVIVLREGSYHESLSVTKAVTIQAYPGEEVWLDGSTQYTSWSGSGPYTATLGPNWSPISTTGFPLTTDPYGNLPEQVWIDGVAQKQIADGATPSAGQFSVNRSAH